MKAPSISGCWILEGGEESGREGVKERRGGVKEGRAVTTFERAI